MNALFLEPDLPVRIAVLYLKDGMGAWALSFFWEKREKRSKFIKIVYNNVLDNCRIITFQIVNLKPTSAFLLRT